MTKIEKMGEKAKSAGRVLMTSPTLVRNKALDMIAGALLDKKADILAANAADLAEAEKNSMGTAMLDRLRLSEARIEEMARGVKAVAAEEDPIGKVIEGTVRPNGLQILKTRVPLGVVGVIFESRPNVTSDVAALCLKSANAVILRGGKEAFSSNSALTKIMREAVACAGLPEDCVQLIEDTSRESAKEMMCLKSLDLLIPRGGKGLINAVVENAKVPVIETGAGNCHMYIDAAADFGKAVELVFNAKTSRPSVCNAIETLLVHETAAQDVLPAIADRLLEKSVEIRGCEKTRLLLPGALPATDEDYATEFNDYILAVKIVASPTQAAEHIAQYTSGHSECIVTEDYETARWFTKTVDAAAVYVNASTRFTDGGEFGLGAEIGISTGKLHARGPMGIEALTSTKYVVFGNGQIRE
ncbi:MAG TPA: glutamate-5-semialdehyde dehydrogenase [Ruminococcaceae bacterium]|nr:glutamate-5-semialdehyde dehydrogenase [Oscillospiraceae bacterium]